jgi:hypothetical protein
MNSKTTSTPPNSLETNEKSNSKKRNPPKTRMGKTSITTFISPEAHKQLKFIALEEDKQLKELMLEAIDQIFIKYRNSEAFKNNKITVQIKEGRGV